jgi:hypothetical protein
MMRDTPPSRLPSVHTSEHISCFFHTLSFHFCIMLPSFIHPLHTVLLPALRGCISSSLFPPASSLLKQGRERYSTDTRPSTLARATHARTHARTHPQRTQQIIHKVVMDQPAHEAMGGFVVVERRLHTCAHAHMKTREQEGARGEGEDEDEEEEEEEEEEGCQMG